MIRYRIPALVAATLFAAAPLAAQDIPEDIDVVALPEWHYDDLYSAGVSAEDIIDRDVYGQNGDEIGDVEDIVIGPNGKVLSIVAEVGGFWDIGDTHVSIPIDEVDMADDRITVPVTEETVDDYGFWDDEDASPTEEEVETGVLEGVDDARLPRAWRVSELVGDRARLDDNNDEARHVNYGYVNDVLLRNNEVAAVVVQPRGMYGGGYRAYPYYGYGSGWYAGAPYYDMPYSKEDVGDMEEFDYDRFDS